MSGPPMEYDPRRLFPFGLSPIPEVPSELASEVSSMYSYAYDDEESEAETEVEGEKTPASIMYSGSCSSVKTNATLEDKAQANGSSTEESSTDDESGEEDSEDDEGNKVIIQAVPLYKEEITDLSETIPEPELCNNGQLEPKDDDCVNESSEDEEGDGEEEEMETCDGKNHYSSQVTAVTHQRAFNVTESQENHARQLPREDGSLAIICPSASSSNLDPSPGAIAATEIFHHLQATRDRAGVTTELAKILSVLQTTLKEDSSASSSSDDTADSDDSKEPTPEPVIEVEHPKPALPLGKPPVYPISLRGAKSNVTKVGPQIQQRIKELASIKPEKGKEEMNILSKILVTLLCSCKSAEATLELRRIIKHFREAANEASDEVGDEIKPFKSRRSSSRASRRRRRSRNRRSNSNGSNTSQSEAESLTNTLTPCNTDSKSSGTEDEGIAAPKRNSKCLTPTNENSEKLSSIAVSSDMKKEDANVSFTISLPRRSSIEVAEITASISPTKMLNNNTITCTNLNEDDEEWEWEEEEDASSNHSSKSRNGKRLDSTSSRELSSSDLSKQDHSIASSTTRKLLTDMECGAYNSDSMYSPGHTSGHSDGVSMSEQSHESPILEGDSDCLEESQNDEDEEVEEEDEEEEEENLYAHLEETFRVLNGTYQIITGVQTESSSIQNESLNLSETISKDVCCSVKQTHSKVPTSRPSSKLSRPASRRSNNNGENEEEWGNEEDGDWEWEYYYEDDGNRDGDDGKECTHKVAPASESNRLSQDKQHDSSQDCKKDLSRPVSRQRKLSQSRPGSRNGSRAGSRPSSRASKKDHLGNVREVKEDEDWEWEYYYEEGEDEELGRLSPAMTTAPTTRATSPFPDQLQALRQALKHADEGIVPPVHIETANSKNYMISYFRAFESFHNDPDWYNPINELSVALAAEYFGQKSEEMAKSLPADFAETHSNADFDRSEFAGSFDKKKRRKHHNNKGSGDENSTANESGDKKLKKKKKKKKSDGKFLPKITVKDLVRMLEPQLFQDDDSGTKMVMQEEVARTSIAKTKHNQLSPNSVSSLSSPSKSSTSSPQNQGKEEEPIKKEVVIIHDPKNPNQVEVCMDGQSTFVTMRPHSRKSLGARSKDSKKGKKSGISKDKTLQSPSESEAYGTGSSASEVMDNCPNNDDSGREEQPSRHSRLLKILQESEESDCFPNSDHDSISSLPHTGGVAVERKLSFRSIKSSGRESDGDSISGEMVAGGAKPSPPTIKRAVQQTTAPSRYMNLNLQSCYNIDPITPSSSEMSTPSSPGYLDYTQFGSLERRKRMSAPTTPSSFRMWPTFEEPEKFDFSEANKEIEEVLRKKSLVRTLQESRLMGNASPLLAASEKGRGSPSTIKNSPALVRTSSPMSYRQSPTFRHSPKLEQELMELANFPPAPSTLPRFRGSSYYK